MLMFLVIGELAVIVLILILRFIIKKMETRKIDNILEFINHKANQTNSTDKFRECLELIKQNNKMEEKCNGK